MRKGGINMGFFDFLFKKDKNKLLNTANVEQNSLKPKEEITFLVEGISDSVIQKELKSMIKEEKNIDCLYEGLSNEEILEKYSNKDKIYEVGIYGDYEMQLIPEPENIYDSNAIKVVHKEIGDVGYVPVVNCKKVKKAIEDGYSVEWRSIGGKYKYIRYDSEKYKKVVRVNNNEYGIMMILTKA